MVYGNLASVKKKNNDLKNALIDLSFAVRLKPDYYIAFNNRGSINFEMKDYKDAVADFDQVITTFQSTIN